MDKIQQQSIILILDSIENQVKGVKRLLGINIQEEKSFKMAESSQSGPDYYTSKEEDTMIEKAMALNDKKDILLKDIIGTQTGEMPEEI